MENLQKDWNTTQQYTADNCTVTITKWVCGPVKLSHVTSNFTGQIAIPAAVPDEMIRLHFGIRGNYALYHRQLDRTFNSVGGHHNMMYSRGFDIIVENKTLALETFDIEFPQDLFIRYTENASEELNIFCENIVKGKSVLLGDDWLVIQPATLNVIQDIITCKFTGQLKKLYIFSKAIEVLVLSAEAYNATKRTGLTFLKTNTDKEKLLEVKELINNRLTDPPSLSEIARSVGLNEYKLKRGFKELFDMTVFGYLVDQRLLLARRKIIDTEKTIAEIAYEMSYASPQHFNAAFKKKFGHTPIYVRNNPANIIG